MQKNLFAVATTTAPCVPAIREARESVEKG